MSGTKKGGQLARDTNIKRYGEDFYATIGRKGGENSKSGGFASKKVGKDGLTGSQRASKWGAVGGAKSKRTKRLEAKIRKEIMHV